MKTIGLLSLVLVLNTAFLQAQTLKDAIRLSENEEYEKAEKAFEVLLTSNPENGLTYYYYGENYFNNKQLEKARMAYQKGIELFPGNAINYVGLGKIYYVANKMDEANNNFFTAKTLSKSKNPLVLMELADVYINSELKNCSEAIKLLNQAAGLDTKNPEIYTLIGDAYLEQGDGSLAIANYEHALDIDKKYTKAILREGKLWSRAKNYNLALEYYNKAIGIDSTFAPAFQERAELRFRAGQTDRAVGDYKKYLQLNDNLNARIRYAKFKYLTKDYKSCIEESSAILAKDSSDITLYRFEGYSYYEMGKYQDALHCMNHFFNLMGSVSKTSTNSETKFLATDYEYLGKSALKNQQDSIGIGAIEKAIKMDSTKWDLYGEVASAELKAKKFNLAITYYEKKINAAPTKEGGANDYYGLGRAYYYSKDYVHGDTCFAKLIRLQPTLPYGYLWRALCNLPFDQNEKKELKGLAYPFFEKFTQTVAPGEVERNKKDLIEAYEYLGYYNMLIKDFAKAKESWTKLKEIDPENVKAKKALADQNLK